MIDKDVLIQKYWKEKKSMREIAKELNCAKSTVWEDLRKNNIPIRGYSEAQKLKYISSTGNNYVETVQKIVDEIKISTYKPIKRKDQWISLPLSYFKDEDKDKECTLTLVLSDTHFGDSNVLLYSLWSSVNNLLDILKILSLKFKIKKFNIVLNGDIVSGRQVYRYQVFRNLLTRGHWQVFLAEKILKDILEKIETYVPVENIFLIRGTHESLEENYILYLKRVLPNSKYLSHAGIIDVGEPLGHYNILFTHGKGKSYYYPISYEQIREIWKVTSQYLQNKILIERSCVSHSHWLCTNLELEGAVVDITGGYQKWEYSIPQRPCGMILYLYYNKDVTSIPIKPDREIERKEKLEKALEYKNMKLYGDILLKHVKDIERVIE